METSPASRAEVKDRQFQTRNLILKWAITIFSGLAIYLAPVPEGVTPQSWRLLAIFIATIVGSILRPATGGAMVLLGIAAIALTKSMPLSEAMIGTVTDPSRPDSKAVETLRIKSTLAGYADPVVWLVLAAFFMSRAMIKTGLGRRIALLFIRAIGHRSLGLGYALAGTDFLLASVIPSNGARSGVIIFMYQCEVIISATFLTGQTGNLLIQRFARQQGGIDLNYPSWLLGAIAPSLVCLMITPPLLYRLFPPEVTHTPDAAKFARTELEKLGRMTWREKAMLCVFAFVAFMWATTNELHTVDYSVVAMAGVCLLLLTNVISWEDALAERAAWDVFIWYGGMVRMAEALGESGITKKFAESSAGFTSGWKWWAALGLLSLIYFYAHYAFASISAHALAMYTPFLIVVTLAGAPPFLAASLLAYFSSLSAGLTHYGTTPGPIYFGADYVTQQKWWQLGLIASVANILIWASVGLVWWKLLGWW